MSRGPRNTGAVRMRTLKTLHRGFDKLDIAIKGALLPNDIETLEAARLEAEKNHHDTLVEIGPDSVAMHVAESGLKGGYAFRCDTGPIGELWFFKRGLSRNDWNLRVSIKALALATRGLKEVHQHILETLQRLGMSTYELSVGRVDYAMDYLMPLESVLNPAHFISHSRSSRVEHAELPKSAKEPHQDELLVHWAGRIVKAVTIGKMPGQQLIVYDKRREIVAHGKHEWLQIWNIYEEELNAHAIFRVELRAGKKHLRDWNIRNFCQLENKAGDMFRQMMKDMRHVVPHEKETNPSRWSPSRLWLQVGRDLKEGLADNFTGAVRGRIITGSREVIFQQRRKQILDCVPGALMASCPNIDGAYGKRGQLLRDLANEMDRADKKKLTKKLQKAKDRLHFI